jgi:hypothetical protein
MEPFNEEEKRKDNNYKPNLPYLNNFNFLDKTLQFIDNFFRNYAEIK